MLSRPPTGFDRSRRRRGRCRTLILERFNLKQGCGALCRVTNGGGSCRVRSPKVIDTTSRSSESRSSARASAKRREVATSRVIRGFAHLTAGLPFVVAAVAEIRRGWIPDSDNAVITLRSWEVLGVHPPALGQYSEVSQLGGHRVFDLGPLLYWLLAIPVHIDNLHGSLWGAALLCVLAASLSVEAARTARGAVAALVVAGAIAGLVVAMPALALDALWNPYLGAVWLVCALMSGWAVVAGHVKWLPVLVLASSVAAQAHFMYALIALAVGMLGLAVALSQIRRREVLVWTLVALAVGAVCWIMPFDQELRGNPGNMSAIFANSGNVARFGWVFSFHSYAAAAGVLPLWWSTIRAVPSATFFDRISAAPALEGMLVPYGFVLIVVGGWVRQRRALAALGSVTLATSVGVLLTFAWLPTTSYSDLWYLEIVLWPIGMLVWATSIWAVGELAAVFVVRLCRGNVCETSQAQHRWPSLGAAALAAVVVGALAIVSLSTSIETNGEVGVGPVVQQVRIAVREITERVTRGPVLLSVVGMGTSPASFVYATAIMWQLEIRGWTPELARGFALNVGPETLPTPSAPVAHMRIVGYKVVLSITSAST